MPKLYSPSKTIFNIPTGKGDKAIPIQIAAPDIKAENLPLSTWTASVVLAGQLHKFDFSLPRSTSLNTQDEPMPVLELGAGTGLVGLSAACLWHTAAVLTDLTPIVPGLDENIALNRRVIGNAGGIVECAILDWSRPSSLLLTNTTDINTEHFLPSTLVPSSKKARVILAADTIYDPEHPGLLAGVILEWLERGADARLCVCYPLRVAYLDEIRELWGRLERAGLVCVSEGREVFGGESPNGDDEMLCEWCVWGWGVDVELETTAAGEKGK
jgi:hypothetical protein